MILSPVAQKLLGEPDPQVRRMVIAGQFPLPPAEQTYLICTYAGTADRDMRMECVKALHSLPHGIITGMLGDASIPAGMLLVLSAVFQNDHAMLEAILRHPATPDQVFVHMASSTDEAVLRLVVAHDERWMRSSSIADALVGNPALPPDLVGRFMQHVQTQAETAAAGNQPESGEESLPPSPDADASAPAPAPGRRAPVESEEDSKRSLAGRISKLGVSDKIKLAMMGNKEVRGILVKESNKLVCTAVIKNPRITEAEIVKISSDRNICEDIIRMIAHDRNWSQVYQIKSNLIMHPKTPVALSIRWLPTLTTKDLQTVSKSKNVPAALTVNARKILTSRNK